MKVKDIMAKPPLTVTEGMTLEDVARFMLDQRIGGVPVVDDNGMLTGIITESSFAAKNEGVPFSTFSAPQLLGEWIGEEGVAQIYEAARRRTAADIMTRIVVTVTEDATVDEVVALMLKHDINRIPVVTDGKPVGIVARHDLLRMLYNP